MPSNRAREYSLPAYGYNMASRPNAHIYHGAYVHKINFAGKRAESITYVDTDNANTTHTVKAKEIILSAEAIESPQLLMLSGVGPADHLKSLGIPVNLDSPDIGPNLRDHNYGSIETEVTPDIYKISLWENETYLNEIKQQFHQNHDGPLANAPASSFSLVRVPDDIPAGPAGEFHRWLLADRGQLQMQYANVALLQNTSATTVPIMTLWVALVQPEGTRTVRPKTSNFWDYPLIDTAYFSSEGDQKSVLWEYKKLCEVIQSDLLKQVVMNSIPVHRRPLTLSSGRRSKEVLNRIITRWLPWHLVQYSIPISESVVSRVSEVLTLVSSRARQTVIRKLMFTRLSTQQPGRSGKRTSLNTRLPGECI